MPLPPPGPRRATNALKVSDDITFLCRYYDTPKDGASEIAGRAAFWKGVTVAKK